MSDQRPVFVERRSERKDRKRGRDVFVVILCFSGISISLFLFQQDLYSSFQALNVVQAGTVTIKYNTVQRRLQDRFVWDRLFDESPVFNGDLIRIARQSGATLNIDNNSIELGENTLIRVQKNADLAHIEFFSGGINIISGQDSGMILLSVGDRVVEAVPGTVFSARTIMDSYGDEGVVLHVTEGAAQIIQDGQVLRMPAGTVLIQDAQGNTQSNIQGSTQGIETFEPIAAVMQPRPNARLLKTEAEPLNVEFVWARINMQPDQLLRLEISQDRNFSRDVRTIDNLDSRGTAPLNAGIWHWRLSSENKVLTAGRVNVTEAETPVLLNPEEGSLFNMRTFRPEIQFRWSAVNDAAHYLLQISSSTNFNNPQFSTQVQGTSFITTNLDVGTWYWRVQPVFSSVHEGQPRFSRAANFHIEQREQMQAPSLNLPPLDSMMPTGENRGNFSFSWANIREAEFYTIVISNNRDLSDPIVSSTTRNNFFVFDNEDTSLAPGRYFWSVSYTDLNGFTSPMSQARSFLTMEREIVQRLISPADHHRVEAGQLADLSFSWETNLTLDRRFQVSSQPDFSSLEIDRSVNDNFIRGISVNPGEWYWRVTARPDAHSPPVPAVARRFTLIPPPVPVARVVAAPVPDAVTAPVTVAPPVRPQVTAPAPPPVRPQVTTPVPPQVQHPPEPPPPLRLTLISPAQGINILGLTALRQPTVFRWETTEEMVFSRFVLSRNADPTVGRAEVEIINPDRSVTVESLSEGVWYWTVEGRSRDGRSVTAVAPRQLRVMPVPLLPAPEDMLPVDGYRIDAEEIRRNRNIVFRWSEVEGANSYILTLFSDDFSRRRRILQTDPITETSYTFDNLRLLDNLVTFYWQVEPVYVTGDGLFEQRGQAGENSFMLDIQQPGRIQPRDMGILYGME